MTYGFTTDEVMAICAEEAEGLDPTCPADRETIRWRIDARLATYRSTAVRTAQRHLTGRTIRTDLHVRRAIADRWIASSLGLDTMVA